MNSFIALDNNCYLSFIIQRNNPWLSITEDFLTNLNDFNSKPIINKHSYDYVLNFCVSLQNILEDKYVRNLLIKYAKNQSDKYKNQLSSFVNSVDIKQFNEILKTAISVLKRNNFGLIIRNSDFLRNLFDSEEIEFFDLGKKKNLFSNKLFKTDTEDAVLVEELYAIKSKKFKKGFFYSEDTKLINAAKQENALKIIGINIRHIKELKRSI